MNDPKTRDRLLEALNQSTLDIVGPVGTPDRQMGVLSEMNSLADDHDAFVKSLAPGIELTKRERSPLARDTHPKIL